MENPGNSLRNIKICSFNCNSVRKRIDIIRNFTMKYDVICLQELLLLHEDSDVLFSISEDFDCYMIPSKRSKS